MTSNFRNNTPKLYRPIKTFSVDALSVRIYHQELEMAKDAALSVLEYLQNLITRHRKANVILATGNSQIMFLRALTTLGGIDWSQVTLFHLDEYLGISADHPASFRYYLQEKVEKFITPRQFHYIQGDTNEPLEECDRYTQLLSAQPIDLVLLGIGDNGHLAFNDPSVANFNDPQTIKLVKLDLTSRQQQVNQGHFPHLDAVPQYAFTVTIPAICSAKKIFCLAPEKRKAEVIRNILYNPISTIYPASILRQKSQATLFLDTNSASLISK
ncbi:glucosamine/galactosamine-6-phosphate isomerase [Trichodesmium erythraeum IMS101]|uniref:Glucosamine/galactosamine-6-phosphate isomerase n=2 Tax=Trichodesmium erythraeum TaxID=1206 RepID=Q111K2_TRIEI|nr:glucosamine-6-phosphate deaminase [Trichodesmium erythraeum GBRTRLIN201]MDE5093259.1 glucosamine-6-phosphate deaminase [Trichodesmium sp. St11_bin5]